MFTLYQYTVAIFAVKTPTYIAGQVRIQTVTFEICTYICVRMFVCIWFSFCEKMLNFCQMVIVYNE